ncbi:MAG TPA: thioredoxin [Elusimicrobiales bacterium]|mgnify:CR=1 FL=1|nr:thioredoxin [Elusimicrobiales bacterium]HOL62955.1 thioredoxin [Elusimicrobiales bacterium]HPO96215.1 thioredoxin [Elusimicrobiales bacterium]
MALNITDQEFDKEVIKSAIPVLVDFWAPWCGPCRMLAPVVDEISKEYEGKVKVVKVNTDENPQSASNYQISAFPTLLFFKDGKVVKELVGVLPKEEIKKVLDEVLK